MTKPTMWLCAHRRLWSDWADSLGIHPVWSESSLSAWKKLGSLATHWAHSEDSDQTGQMPRLIWVFAGRTLILLVLSWGGSFSYFDLKFCLKIHCNVEKSSHDFPSCLNIDKSFLQVFVVILPLLDLLFQIFDFFAVVLFCHVIIRVFALVGCCLFILFKASMISFG